MKASQEKDAEIERLQARVDLLTRLNFDATARSSELAVQFQKAKEWNQLSEIQIKNLQSIIEAQNDLLTRAADALQPYALGFPDGSDIRALIAELRKAAE